MKLIRASAIRLHFLPSLLLPCCLLLAATSLPAQTKPDTPLLFCVSYAQGFSSLSIQKPEGQYQEIALSTADVVELADAPVENGSLSLYGPADNDGKPTLAATVKLSGTASPLIVLNPAAAGTHVYHPKTEDGAALAITIDYKPEKERLLLSSSNWASRDDRRTLVCIIEDPSSQRMAIKSIPLRPVEKP